jgi:U4/U6 small nuclear ribonucleoprotein PRP4
MALKGHEHTISKVDFHPFGRHVVSTSHDMTWSLWDVSTQ